MSAPEKSEKVLAQALYYYPYAGEETFRAHPPRGVNRVSLRAGFYGLAPPSPFPRPGGRIRAYWAATPPACLELCGWALCVESLAYAHVRAVSIPKRVRAPVSGVTIR
jgi:hypothetical protein